MMKYLHNSLISNKLYNLITNKTLWVTFVRQYDCTMFANPVKGSEKEFLNSQDFDKIQ